MKLHLDAPTDVIAQTPDRAGSATTQDVQKPLHALRVPRSGIAAPLILGMVLGAAGSGVALVKEETNLVGVIKDEDRQRILIAVEPIAALGAAVAQLSEALKADLTRADVSAADVVEATVKLTDTIVQLSGKLGQLNLPVKGLPTVTVRKLRGI